ncbi:MAG: TRAP transporter large permease subunit, partial [Halohasta sp.]
FLLIERLSVDRSAWLTIVAIVGLLAVITAYDERTKRSLFGTLGGLFALSAVSYLLVGGGITTLIDTLVSGGGFGGGLPLGEAIPAALPSWIWITLWVGLSFSAFNYRGSSPLLDFDPQVDATLGTIIDRLSLPNLTENRMARFGTFVFKSMDSGARTATEVVIAVAAAGIIPGVITVTGLGPNLTSLLRVVAGDSLVLLLVITAFACIILGMGMPTTVTYIILVSMLGPALEGFGLAILAAHLFILYFGVIADITPPVAVAAYAASGIAKSDQFMTGVKAFSLSLNKALVPFAFVFAPGILLVRGSGEEAAVIGLSDVADLGFFVPEVLIPILALTVGVAALGPSVIGYLYSPVDGIERAAFGVASLALTAPLLVHGIIQGLLGLVGLQLGVDPLVFDLVLRGLGLVLFVALVVDNRRASEDKPKSAAPGAA